MIPESLRGIARGQFRLYTPYSRGTAKTQPFPGTNGSFYGIAFVHHTPATVACQHWANVDHASKCNVNFKSWYILGIALGFCWSPHSNLLVCPSFSHMYGQQPATEPCVVEWYFPCLNQINLYRRIGLSFGMRCLLMPVTNGRLLARVKMNLMRIWVAITDQPYTSEYLLL